MCRSLLQQIKQLTEDALLRPCNRIKCLVEIQQTVDTELNVSVFSPLSIKRLKQINIAIQRSREISRSFSEWVAILNAGHPVSRQLINTRLSHYLQDIEAVSDLQIQKLTTEEPEDALTYCTIGLEATENEIERLLAIMELLLTQLSECKVQFKQS